MKKVFLLLSAGILVTILGCSGNPTKTVSKRAPAAVHASVAPASTSPVVESAPVLPVAPHELFGLGISLVVGPSESE